MKIKKYSSLFFIIALITAQVFLFQNCGRDYGIGIESASTIGSGNGEGSGDGSGGGNGDGTNNPSPTCETTFIEEEGVVKIVFLIDVSGSNAPGRGNTDPNKFWRKEVINQFRAKYITKTNFYYNFTSFANSKATSHSDLVMNGKTLHFSNNIEEVNTAFTKFTNTADTGNTPYDTATQKVKSIITSDLSNNQITATDKYVVVMLSDGEPNPVRSVDQVKALVNDLKSVANEKISFNTVYYYTGTQDVLNTAKSLDAQSKLSAMAQVGQGSFIIANSNQTLEIDNIIRIPKEVCN